MICAFFCTFTLDGICYVFGVFLNPLKKDFGVGDGAMSAVGSVLSGKVQKMWPNKTHHIVLIKNECKQQQPIPGCEYQFRVGIQN